MDASILGYLVAAYGPCPPNHPGECSVEDPTTFIEDKCIPCLTEYWLAKAKLLKEQDEGKAEIDGTYMWVSIQSLN